jgi:hypothetical protein
MNKPFIIEEKDTNKYVVSWPTFEDIRTIESGMKLLRLLFDELKNYEIGLVLNSSDDTYVMYITYIAFAQSGSHLFDIYQLKRYNIAGVVFDNKTSAEKLVEHLEKKYIWRLLQA